VWLHIRQTVFNLTELSAFTCVCKFHREKKRAEVNPPTGWASSNCNLKHPVIYWDFMLFVILRKLEQDDCHVQRLVNKECSRKNGRQTSSRPPSEAGSMEVANSLLFADQIQLGLERHLESNQNQRPIKPFLFH